MLVKDIATIHSKKIYHINELLSIGLNDTELKNLNLVVENDQDLENREEKKP